MGVSQGIIGLHSFRSGREKERYPEEGVEGGTLLLGRVLVFYCECVEDRRLEGHL